MNWQWFQESIVRPMSYRVARTSMAEGDQLVQEVGHGGCDGGGTAPVLLHQVQPLSDQAGHKVPGDGRVRCLREGI